MKEALAQGAPGPRRRCRDPRVARGPPPPALRPRPARADRGHGLRRPCRSSAVVAPPADVARGRRSTALQARSASSSAGFTRWSRRSAARADRPLLPDLPGELVPATPSLLEAEVPELLARAAGPAWSPRASSPTRLAIPGRSQRAALRGRRGVHPDRAADPGGGGHAAGRRPGRADGRRQDDDGRQARGQLQAGARASRRAWSPSTPTGSPPSSS